MGCIRSRQDRDVALSVEEGAGECLGVHEVRQEQGELRERVEDAEEEEEHTAKPMQRGIKQATESIRLWLQCLWLERPR